MSTNAFKILRDLLPNPPLQVGTVVSANGGVLTLSVAGGGTAQARGDAAVDSKVFFRDGVVEGAAPTLTLEVIEI
jgi:hypothetical protein